MLLDTLLLCFRRGFLFASVTFSTGIKGLGDLGLLSRSEGLWLDFDRNFDFNRNFDFSSNFDFRRNFGRCFAFRCGFPDCSLFDRSFFHRSFFDCGFFDRFLDRTFGWRGSLRFNRFEISRN